jgi:hypothetical protein
MTKYKVGYFVGSLSSTSINRELSQVLINLAPEDLEFTEIPIGNLPLYSQDYDANYPPEATALKDAIRQSDAILFVTPEYNRSIPGALKNAIDWASRPWGPERLRPHPGRRDRRIHRPDRHSRRATKPASGAELLQRPADDRTRGLHHLLPRDIPRGRQVRQRVDHGLPQELHGRVPRPRRAGPDRPAPPAVTAGGRY